MAKAPAKRSTKRLTRDDIEAIFAAFDQHERVSGNLRPDHLRLVAGFDHHPPLSLTFREAASYCRGLPDIPYS